MEHKRVSGFVKSVDQSQGIVEHLIAVHGVLDLGGDISHLGAFTKTLRQRWGQTAPSRTKRR
jgi:hypothetical protein